MDNINTENTQINTNYAEKEFAMRQILKERYRSKLKLGDGVTAGMVADSVRFIMKHKGAEFWTMTGEELANAVNCMTSCCYKNCA